MKGLIFLLIVSISVVASAQDIIAQAELKAENVNEISVQGSFVDIYVTKGDEVYFKGIIKGNGDKGDYRFDTDIVGSALIIKVVNNKNRYNWRNYRINESRIDITIPEGVELEIDNSSGDVNVANLRAAKSKIEASSGDITLRGIICNLEVETSSGDIDIVDLIGDSEVESTSGDQEYRNVKGSIEATSSSGDITFVDFDGDLDVKATSGDVELRTGKGALQVRTTSGEIEGENITLTGNADFDATSGNIEVDFTNDLNELSFDLTASSGDLEVGDREAEKRLKIQREGYLVRGVTSAGDQEYN